jgi:hypothetical protein
LNRCDEKLIDSRQRVLREIATKYTDLVDTLNGNSGVPGDGSSVVCMPGTYTDSVREFERLAKVMRHTSDQVGRYHGFRLKTLRFHLDGWYLEALRGSRSQPVLRANKQGKLVQQIDADGKVVMFPQPYVLRRRDAKQDRAELALRWIAEHWALGHEPFLPRELTEELRVAA